jgi:hypothetical protein
MRRGLELAWMTGLSVLAWLAIDAVSGRAADREVLAGMAGPLAAAVASWVVYERAYRSAPERLTNVMIAALAVKMVFFGGYVAVMLRVLQMRPVPFVVSFAGYFIALYAMEALFLRRLLKDGLRSPSRERA